MTSRRHPGSLLQELDLDPQQFLDLVTPAARAARRPSRTARRPAGWPAANIALIFEKNSTRTRCAFEVAAYDQGAHVTYLGPEGSHIGREEIASPTPPACWAACSTASSSAASPRTPSRSSPRTPGCRYGTG